MNELQTMPY